MRTEDYLVSLRKGDYVDILNWLNFLTEYYSAPNQPLEADTIIPLMSFELINHGFKKTDGNIIQKIYIILNNNMVASGQLQYALTLLVSAILQCQIYAEFNLLSFYQTTEKFNAKQIKSWMTREVKDDPKLKLTAAENSAALEEKYKSLENKLSNCQKDLEELEKKINLLISLQEICKKYVDAFSQNNGSAFVPEESSSLVTRESVSTIEPSQYIGGDQAHDAIEAMRFGVIQALSAYLNSQVMVTSYLPKQVDIFINKIRNLKPYEWEEKYLSQLTTKPMIQEIYERAANKLRFFATKFIANIVPIEETKELSSNSDSGSKMEPSKF